MGARKSSTGAVYRPSKSRFDEHLSRKFFHVIAGTLIAYLLGSSVLTRTQGAVMLVALMAVLVPLELLRFRMPALNNFIFRVYGPLMRKSERDQPSGQLFYLLGLAWALFFLPRVIALQAILILAWMDPIAALFGVRFGRVTWNSVFKKFFVGSRSLSISLGAKTVEGSAAGFLAAFLAGVIAWTGYWAAIPRNDGRGLWWPMPLQVLVMSVSGGLSAIVAEAWPSQWDDNVNIPFWSGLVVWVVALLWGLPLLY